LNEANRLAARDKKTYNSGFLHSKGNMLLLGQTPSDQKIISVCERSAN
jgi:hypothetical protein